MHLLNNCLVEWNSKRRACVQERTFPRPRSLNIVVALEEDVSPKFPKYFDVVLLCKMKIVAKIVHDYSMEGQQSKLCERHYLTCRRRL